MWSISNCARPLQKCNAPTANLIGQKALYIVHVEFACVTRKLCRLKKRFDSLTISNYVIKKGNAFTELDMENLRSRLTVTRPSTHGNDAERGKMPQVKITQEFYTDFCVIRSTVNHKEKLDKVSKVRALLLCITIGALNLTDQERTSRWPPDPTGALRLHWKIISSENPRNIKSRAHHKFKTEGEITWNSRYHTGKEHKLRRKPGGDSGHLQPGGRAINVTTSCIFQVVLRSDFAYSRWNPL